MQTCLLAPSEEAIRLPAVGRAGTDGWRLSVIDRPVSLRTVGLWTKVKWVPTSADLLLTVHHPLIMFVRGRKSEPACYSISIVTNTNDSDSSIRSRAVDVPRCEAHQTNLVVRISQYKQFVPRDDWQVPLLYYQSTIMLFRTSHSDNPVIHPGNRVFWDSSIESATKTVARIVMWDLNHLRYCYTFGTW